MGRATGAAFTVHAAGIAALLLLAYAYVFPHWADWNQNSRFDLTVAIVDHGTLSIDCCVDNTGDYARVDGRTYTDKAPGLSLLAVPVYALFRAAATPQGWIDRAVQRLAASAAFAPTLRVGGTGLQPEKVRFALALTIASALVVALPSALFGAVLLRFLLAAGAGTAAAIATVLAYGLGTIACVYAGAFYAHQLVAALCFTAFALLAGSDAAASPLRCLAVGLLLGMAVISEYPAVLLAVIVGGFAITRVGFGRRLIWITLGGLAAAGGSGRLRSRHLRFAASARLPLFGALATRHQVGFVSLSTPSLAALWGITGSPYRGLFFLSPILLLALPGFVTVLRRPALRSAGLASAGGVAAFLLFNASSVMWWGGFAIGPRYLVPMLPFLAWPLAFTLEEIWRRAGWRIVAACLALASLVGVWGLRLAGQQFPEEQWTVPWLQYAWPRLRAGDVARNAGMLLGLRGWSSLLPLLVASVVVVVVWWRMASRCQALPPKGKEIASDE